MPRLEVSLFGTFQAQLDGKPLTNFRSVNTQALFAYLIMQAERPFARELLATLFWPDVPDSTAKKNLRQTLYQLRQLLEDSDDQPHSFLHINRQSVQWNAGSDYRLDIQAYLTHLEHGVLAAAVLEYRGELLPGFTCDSLEFESWLRQERERLHRLALTALDDLTERYLAQEKFPEAQKAARRQLALEPWREAAHRQLMRALALAGDRSAALAQFELCRQSLAEELGAEPEWETANLAAQIEAGAFGKDDESLIAGLYELGEQIGQGAMGTVYRGRHNLTGQPVAIKMLDRSRVAANPELVERFRREGEALRQLAHPNIATLLATDEKEGHHFLVMEYVEGGDLLGFLQAQPQPPLPQVLSLALDLADALTRAHHLNILHRDIKPANVLLDANGRPKLTDFGIARLGEESTLTQNGAVLGTVAYLSPEACRGEPLDERADIWAFGLLLYEMLAGKRPFAKPTSAATLLAILQEPIPDIRGIRQDLPPALTDLLGHMVMKDKTMRIASVRQVGAALEAILRGSPHEQVNNIQKTPTLENLLQTAPPPIHLVEDSFHSVEEQRARQVLLNKVQQYWVEGVLQQTLHAGGFIDIAMETKPDAVANPWEGIVSGSQSPITITEPIEEVFVHNGRSLLILGEPGSGKTVMLLQLADRMLVLARQEMQAPIPVVLNLASWAKKPRPLEHWLVDELNEKYLIPKKMAETWIEANQLLLLLDGLDEVDGRHQRECAQAINDFRQAFGLTPIALCCRTGVYESLEIPLKLNGAIVLKPLTIDQTESYLSKFSDPISAIHHAFHANPLLQEIARSPLMLKVMVKAFHLEDTGDSLPKVTDATFDPMRKDALLDAIFHAYVQQMVREIATTSPFHWQQARHWLGQLAKKLTEQRQTVFLLESLQPVWLSQRPWRWAYMLITRILLGGFIGVILWLIGLTAPTLGVEAHSRSSLLIAAQLHVDILWIDLIASITFNAIYGFVVALVDIFYFEKRSQHGYSLTASKWDWSRKLAIAALVAVVALIQFLLFGEETQLLILQVVSAAFFFVLLSHFAFGQSYENDIGTVEFLSWSWQASLKGIIPALLIGILFSLVVWGLMGTAVPVAQGMLLTFPITLIVLLLFGLTNRYVDAKTRPNHGIWLSGKNALQWGGLTGILLGLTTLGQKFVLQWWGVSISGLFAVYAGIISALIAGLAFGGFNVINHACLRLLLWRSDQIPRRFVAFLSQATKHVLLHQVGSGYIFIHQSLQTYLSAQKDH